VVYHHCRNSASKFLKNQKTGGGGMADGRGPARVREPDKIKSYFALEKTPLILTAVSGIIYNIGMTAGPWFEGQLAQCLFDIIKGQKVFSDMLRLALLYLAVILLVQGMRCVKRFYVRRFANDTALNMRAVLYGSLVHKPRAELSEESTGTMMTKAVADVDECVEGMRKFTTEVFDTGVALIAYLVMLFLYDWRLALISCAFTPIAYFAAERMKKVVYKYNSEYKKSAGRLNDATLDRISNCLTYRVYGCEERRNGDYENALSDYEKRAVAANVWENTMQPLYNVISMTGVVFIIWLGGRNIAGTGWTAWNIAAFTAFLSCFTKMAVKSSKAAKLFNSVQKARVSWKRIKPLLKDTEEPEEDDEELSAPMDVEAENLSFAYPGGDTVLRDVSFTLRPGEIMGVTGPVACGKSTLGLVFLCETPYSGSVRIGGRELSGLTESQRSRIISYSGHQPELLSDTIAENIKLGSSAPAGPVLEAVRLSGETAEMPEGENTPVGAAGVRLSGGQQARLSLARALYRPGKLLVLDDPFASVDKNTEREIMDNLRRMAGESAVILISHRLYTFPEMDKVMWLEDGRARVSDHETLMAEDGEYARFYRAQTEGGADLDEAQ
jgi:ATP-binding cassette subfamily B multidrug efflux pump